MSLFQIQRYVGDDKIVSSTDQVSQEVAEKNLERLLKKAEKRKRTREKVKLRKAFTPSKKQKKHARVDEGPTVTLVETQTPQVEKATEEPKPEFAFQVIGSDKFNKLQKVKRVLPHWLSHPVKLDANLTDLKVQIDDIPCIEQEFQAVLRDSGITHYFPVQSAVIPYFIQELTKPHPFWPRDICISAATGSGKTLAFVIPVIQVLKYHVVRKIRAVVVLPVKELAVQVYKVFKKFAKVTNVRVTLCTGTIPFEAEKKQLVRKIDSERYIHETDVVVTTPGRLVDHIHMTEGFTLKHLQFLILDEADRMIDREQNDWIYHLEQHMRREQANFRVGKINLQTFQNSQRPPQKILASATLTQDPEKLYRIGLFKPKLFTVDTGDSTEREDQKTGDDEIVGRLAMPKELIQQYVTCSIDMKPQILYYLIKKHKMSKVLCFTGSGLETHRLTLLLRNLSNNTLTVEELSSGLNAKLRKNTLAKFTNGEINVLVSTDALARGLDIQNVDYVISYNAPKHVETYVHRVGRTGRAGRTGTAITLLKSQQKSYFLNMFPTSVQLENVTVEDTLVTADISDETYQQALARTKLDLEGEKRASRDKIQRIKRKLKNSKRPMLK